MGGEVAEGWAVDEGGSHLFGQGGLAERGVAIANGDGGDLCVAIDISLP
jgi:hypothetical protein